MNETSSGITLKELYERVLNLENKFDFALEKGKKDGRYYWLVIFSLLLLEASNFVFNYLIFKDHHAILDLLK